MVETVEKTPQLKGKLTISHAFALATLNEQQVDKLAHRMVAQQISIASTVPIGTLHMPLKQLHDKGVKVMTAPTALSTTGHPTAWATCWKKPICTRSSIFALTNRIYPARCF